MVGFNELKDTSVSLLVHIPHLFLSCSIEMRITGCQPVVYVLIKVSMENNMLQTVKGAFKDIPRYYVDSPSLSHICNYYRYI